MLHSVNKRENTLFLLGCCCWTITQVVFFYRDHRGLIIEKSVLLFPIFVVKGGTHSLIINVLLLQAGKSIISAASLSTSNSPQM